MEIKLAWCCQPMPPDLTDEHYEGVVVLEPHEDFGACIIGTVSDPDVRLVYSYEKILRMFFDRDEMTYAEAQEFIEYNTVRAIPYMGERKPVLVNELWEG